MPIPSECPICQRRMCDHTCYERGQTFAQMMGDPPGTHPHRDVFGCCCDTCTAPGTKPLDRKEWYHRKTVERTFELLQEQAVDRIRFEHFVPDEVWGQACLITEEGSSVDVYVRGKDMKRLNTGDVSHVEMTEDGKLFIWTGGKRKIPITLVGVCYAET